MHCYGPPACRRAHRLIEQLDKIIWQRDQSATGLRLANLSTSNLIPPRSKFTQALAPSPRPSRRRTTPRPKVGWTTCAPIARPSPPARGRRRVAGCRCSRRRSRAATRAYGRGSAFGRDAANQSGIDLAQESRRTRLLALAVKLARQRVGQVEQLARARHADVAQPALLLDLVVDRRAERICGNSPSSIPAMNTIGYSRPLEVCSVISAARPPLESICSLSLTSATRSRNSGRPPP